MGPLPTLLVASLKQAIRDRSALVFTLAFPVIVFVLSSVLKPAPLHTPIPLVVEDRDRSPESAVFLQRLASIRQLTLLPADATPVVAQAVRLVIPEGFSAGNRPLLLEYYDSSWRFAVLTRALIHAALAPEDMKGPRLIPVPGRARNEWLLSGLIGMMLVTGVFAGSAGIVGMRERRILQHLFATPLRPWAFGVAQVIAYFMWMLAQVAILIIIAVAFFGSRPYIQLPELLVPVVLGGSVFLTLGLVISTLVRTSRAASSASLLIAMPMWFLGESFFALSRTAVLMRMVSEALPSTHLNRALREMMLAGAPVGAIAHHLAILGVWMLSTAAMAGLLMRGGRFATGTEP